MPRTPASAWAAAPTRDELVRALRVVVREAEGLSMRLGEPLARAVVDAKDLLAREEHAHQPERKVA